MNHYDLNEHDLSIYPDAKLSIQTLGRFSVSKNGRSLTGQTRSSKKIWNLFKYLLINRNSSQLPETIVDKLCPELNTNHPSNLLHVQVHRLRKLMGEPANASNNSLIHSNNGCYSWNPNCLCHIDADAFVFHSKEALRLQDKLPHEAIKVYQKALSYYQGDFLPENSEDEWVIPHRIFYRHMFIEDVIQLCRLLLDQGKHKQVLHVCEKAVILEPYEESFHLMLLGGLLTNRQVTEALHHYEYITALYYRNMGIPPTQNLKNIYQEIMALCAPDLPGKTRVPAKNSEKKDQSAQWKTRSDFRALAMKENKRCRKEGLDFSLHQFTFKPLPGNKKTQKNLMASLQHFLCSNLRKRDILTQWTPHCIVGLLPLLEENDVTPMLKRLVDAYKKKPDHKGHTLCIITCHDIEELLE